MPKKETKVGLVSLKQGKDGKWRVRWWDARLKKYFRRILPATSYAEAVAMAKIYNTELASEKIHNKLLEMPRDYIDTISGVLTSEGIQEDIIPIVHMGHALSDYKKIINDNEIDLVVINTKDEKQLAMHGMAYALAVEIRDRPLLLL